jgi:hypothetical protein
MATLRAEYEKRENRIYVLSEVQTYLIES